MSLVYVYAFTGEPVSRRKIAGHTIESVHIGDVHAAVERRQEAPPLSEAALREQHAIVVDLSRRVDSIVPARFGALVDEAELARIVSLRADRLHAALRRVRGCVQMTVRVPMGVRESVRAGGGGNHPGADYLQERRAALAPPPAVDLIRAAVRGISSDEVSAVSAAGRQATLAHLVPGNRVAAYRRAVQAAARAQGLESEMVVTGPWPPFAFAPDLWP